MTDTPGDAALRWVVEEMQVALDSSHGPGPDKSRQDDLLDESVSVWVSELARWIRALEANTRHTPGDAALREDVRQLAEMVAAHSESDMCAECRKQARIVLRLLMELEANTRHTPEGGATQLKGRPHVWSSVTGLCIHCDASSTVAHPLVCQPAPQSGAPDAQLVRTEAGRRVDAPDAAESSSGERLGRANDSASGVAPRPQTPGGAPDAPPVVAHCGWCPRVGIKQGLEEYCPGIAPAPPALSAEEREALREALRQEFSHKAMDTIAALLARTEAK